jgi:hypothetical protein
MSQIIFLVIHASQSFFSFGWIEFISAYHDRPVHPLFASSFVVFFER